MGRLKIPSIANASRIFLDTSPFIYWLEEHPVYTPILEPIFSSISAGRKTAFSSVITYLEVLVKPLQKKRRDLVLKYKEILLYAPYFELVKIEPEVCEAAAQLKAIYSIKTPDAIQIAVAKLHHADIFLTNDHGLKRIREVTVIALSDYTS